MICCTSLSEAARFRALHARFGLPNPNSGCRGSGNPPLACLKPPGFGPSRPVRIAESEFWMPGDLAIPRELVWVVGSVPSRSADQKFIIS